MKLFQFKSKPVWNNTIVPFWCDEERSMEISEEVAEKEEWKKGLLQVELGFKVDTNVACKRDCCVGTVMWYIQRMFIGYR